MARLKYKNLKKADGMDKEVLMYMEMLELAYQNSLTDLTRMQEFQNIYDNVVNEAQWPTMSKIPIPMLFNSVEKTLPSIMSYLFPNTKAITLTPMDETVPRESITRAEWALQFMALRRMKLKKYALPTIKDCFKLSVGYGIVEPIIITPPAAVTKSIFNNGTLVDSARVMELGAPRRSLRFRYISPGQILVMKDGTDFNGQNRVSTAFFIDIYTESELRALFSKDEQSGEDVVLSGDVERIIQTAKDLRFDLRTPIVNIVATLGGLDVNTYNSGRLSSNMPALIPVVKVYEENKHTWIANGLTKIFESDRDAGTLRCPLVKCSAWPDGDRWYPMSSPEASMKMGIGVNVYMNALFDLLTHMLKPTMLYDKSKIKKLERGPNSEIGVAGDVDKAARYVETPQMPAQMFTVGEFLRGMYGDTVGQQAEAAVERPGLMRGGAYAFESLLQSTTGREKMAGAILETHFLESALEQTLLYMQMGIGSGNFRFGVDQFDKKKGENYTEWMEATEDDLVHVYEVALDLQEKHRNGAIDQQMRMSEFNALREDPMINQYELRRDLLMDETRAMRLIVPRTEAEAIQREMTQARINAQATQGQEVASPATPTEQGIEGGGGAAALGGGL